MSRFPELHCVNVNKDVDENHVDFKRSPMTNTLKSQLFEGDKCS